MLVYLILMVVFYSYRHLFPNGTSKGEFKCKLALMKLFPNHEFCCVRPCWLENPETGKNLEIDLYNDELKLGVEYNGYQHYVFPNYFHKHKKQFVGQVRRDVFKKKMCDLHRVTLIIVPYKIRLEKIESYILAKLKKAGLK